MTTAEATYQQIKNDHPEGEEETGPCKDSKMYHISAVDNTHAVHIALTLQFSNGIFPRTSLRTSAMLFSRSNPYGKKCNNDEAWTWLDIINGKK